VIFSPTLTPPHHPRADGTIRAGAGGSRRGEPFEHLGQSRCIVGDLLKRHSAIFHEGHRLSGILHRHHDVETRGAQTVAIPAVLVRETGIAEWFPIGSELVQDRS
jgi:hypothetical protein